MTRQRKERLPRRVWSLVADRLRELNLRADHHLAQLDQDLVQARSLLFAQDQDLVKAQSLLLAFKAMSVSTKARL